MAKCNRRPSVSASPQSNLSLSFSSLGRRRIVADFDGGRLTSDAGGLLLREVDRRLGLTAGLAECIADQRDPAKITHDLRTLLSQRVFGIALGLAIFMLLGLFEKKRGEMEQMVAGLRQWER